MWASDKISFNVTALHQICLNLVVNSISSYYGLVAVCSRIMEMSHTLHIDIIEVSMKVLASTVSYRLDICPE